MKYFIIIIYIILYLMKLKKKINFQIKIVKNKIINEVSVTSNMNNLLKKRDIKSE